MSNLALYIDTFARKAITSPANSTEFTLPDIYQGDALGLDIYFCTPTGVTARPYKVERYATATVAAKFADVLASVGPGQGNFKLTFGANTTAALAFDIATATLQTALQGLASIGAGNALVTGVDGTYFIVEFAGTLANAGQSLITGVGVNLFSPSTVQVTRLQAGGGGKNEIQLINLVAGPVASQTLSTEIVPGSTGATVSTTQSGDGSSLHEVQKITWAAAPASGYFTIGFGVLGNTDAILVTATAADIKAAIEAVLGTGKVAVTQKAGAWIEIRFTDFLDYAAVTIDTTNVDWFYGWRGTLTVNDFALSEDPSLASATRYLEIDLTPSGGAAKTVLQHSVTLKRAVGT